MPHPFFGAKDVCYIENKMWPNKKLLFLRRRACRWQKQCRTSKKHSKTGLFGSDQKHRNFFLPSWIQRLTQKHSKTRVFAGSDQKHGKTFLTAANSAKCGAQLVKLRSSIRCGNVLAMCSTILYTHLLSADSLRPHTNVSSLREQPRRKRLRRISTASSLLKLWRTIVLISSGTRSSYSTLSSCSMPKP